MDNKLLPLYERVFGENVTRILNAREGQPVLVECMRAAGRVPFDYMDRLITAAMTARAAVRATGQHVPANYADELLAKAAARGPDTRESWF